MRRRALQLGLAPLVLLVAGCPTTPQIEPIDGRLEVAPDTATLGTIPLATPIEARFEAANVGRLALTLTATLSGLGADDVQITSLPNVMAPGSRRDIVLTIVATEPGPLDVLIDVTTDADTTHSVFVRAERVPSTLRLEPEHVDFDAVRVGRTKIVPVEVHNPLAEAGTVTLTFDDPTGPFRIDGPTTAQLEGGAFHTFDVAFEPKAERTYSGRVRVMRTGGGVGERGLRLAGRGTSSSLACDEDALAFGDVPPERCAERTVRCTNTADDDIELIETALTPPSAPFTVNVPLRRIAPRAHVDAIVEFCPTDLTSTSATLELTVTEDDRRRWPTRVGLSGRGGGPAVSLPSDRLSMGGAVIGGRTRRRLAIDNVGHAPLTISSTWFRPTDAPFRVLASPAPIEPQGRGYVELEFEPQALGEASAELILATNDPTWPEARAVLSGVAVAANPCEMVVAPPSIDFGVVQTGTPVAQEIVLTASGQMACAYFDARLEDGAHFTLTGPTSGVLAPGASATFVVTYARATPSGPNGDLDTFVVDVPNASPATPQVSLRGTSAEPALALYPSVVDYGVVASPDVLSKTVAVFNVGTAPHRVTSVAIDGSTAHTIAQIPGGAPPFELLPGESFEVNLEYTPSAAAIDRGRLQIVSDRIGTLTVPLTGERQTVVCGRVSGTICSASGGVPSVGAKVTVEGTALETTTDPDGRFYLPCVPSGPQTLHLERGHFSRTVNVTVQSGQRTTLPSSTCLDPASAQIAVVRGQWDPAEDILTSLGLPFDLYEGVASPAGILTSSALLASYDILFLNCGLDDSTIRSAAVAANLRAFVEGGGSLYASDQAYDAVEAAFPYAIDFAGDDTVLNAAESGGVSPVAGRVLDPRMLRRLPDQTALTLGYSPNYVRIDGVTLQTTVHVVGQTAAGATPLRPLLVSFAPPAGGRVVFTTFHNTDAEEDPDVTTVLETVLSDL